MTPPPSNTSRRYEGQRRERVVLLHAAAGATGRCASWAAETASRAMEGAIVLIVASAAVLARALAWCRNAGLAPRPPERAAISTKNVETRRRPIVEVVGVPTLVRASAW